MLELAVYLQILVWPLVALCGIGVLASAYHEYVALRDAKLEDVAKLAAAYEQRALDSENKVSALATRVGQLEMAGGVKRGR